MSLAGSIGETLEQRGTSSAAASLAAEAGLAIVRVGFDQWGKDPKDRSLTFHLRAARRQLEAVVGGVKQRARKDRRNP